MFMFFHNNFKIYFIEIKNYFKQDDAMEAFNANFWTSNVIILVYNVKNTWKVLRFFQLDWFCQNCVLKQLQMDESSRWCSTLNCSIIQLESENLVIN
jgi:hypothetical protein